MWWRSRWCGGDTHLVLDKKVNVKRRGRLAVEGSHARLALSLAHNVLDSEQLRSEVIIRDRVEAGELGNAGEGKSWGRGQRWGRGSTSGSGSRQGRDVRAEVEAGVGVGGRGRGRGPGSGGKARDRDKAGWLT